MGAALSFQKKDDDYLRGQPQEGSESRSRPLPLLGRRCAWDSELGATAQRRLHGPPSGRLDQLQLRYCHLQRDHEQPSFVSGGQQVFEFLKMMAHNEVYLRCAQLANASRVLGNLGDDILSKITLKSGVGTSLRPAPMMGTSWPSGAPSP